MTPEASTDHRRATAERNVAAILDGAEALLARGAAASTTAVATEAGVSRVTVYAHFPTREALLEAVAERAVAQATVALESAQLEDGTALEALDRLIAVADGDHLDVLVREGQLDDALNRDAVVGQQQGVRHG